MKTSIAYFSGGYTNPGDEMCRFADRVLIVVRPDENTEQATLRKLGANYLAKSSGWCKQKIQYPGCQAH